MFSARQLLLFKFSLTFSEWCIIFLYHLWKCHMCLIQLESLTWKFLVNGRCFVRIRSPPKGREEVSSQAVEWTLVVVIWRKAVVYMAAKFVKRRLARDKTMASSNWGCFQRYLRLWKNPWTKIIYRYSYVKTSFHLGMLKLYCKVSGDSRG